MGCAKRGSKVVGCRRGQGMSEGAEGQGTREDGKEGRRMSEGIGDVGGQGTHCGMPKGAAGCRMGHGTPVGAQGVRGAYLQRAVGRGYRMRGMSEGHNCRGKPARAEGCHGMLKGLWDIGWATGCQRGCQNIGGAHATQLLRAVGCQRGQGRPEGATGHRRGRKDARAGREWQWHNIEEKRGEWAAGCCVQGRI